MPLVNTRVDSGVAVIEVNNPPVNALSPGVPEAIAAAIDAAAMDGSISAIVVMGGGRTFVAGADITTLERAAFGDPAALPDLHDLLATIEDCSKPVVMAIHGTALGGGLELGMAGHFRVASVDALLGQPEVNLGIIPGAEGTQRLPRLVGVEKALDMCVTGKPLKARDALAAGLIDAVIEGDLATEAVKFARQQAGPVRKTRERSEKLGAPAENAPLFAAAREMAAKTRRRQVAPLKAVDAVEAATTSSFADGCRRERELFIECIQTEQAKALIHLFFAERAASKVRNLPKDAAATPVASVAIVGAGTMGGGIAMACANAGLSVTIKDATQAALDAGMATITRNYESSVKRGRSTPEAVADRMRRIRPSLTYDDFAAADVIIEAVFEGLELKKQVFREIDRVAKPGPCSPRTRPRSTSTRSQA